MTNRAKLKAGYFILEGLNSFATVYYAWYLFFFMNQAFGFDNKANLKLAALSGGVYMVCAWCGGRFSQRFGYFFALKLGFLLMAGALSAGMLLNSATSHVLVMVGMLFGMSFTWPTLEALVSEDETPEGLQRSVGIYNIVWAATGALAYFTGGAMLEKLGFRSLFYVPVAIQLVQTGFTVWLEKLAPPHPHPPAERLRQPIEPERGPTSISDSLNPRPISRARTFLRMAWLANPCAYTAVNTLLAVMPAVAARLHLSTMAAGFCCSLWCFARVAAFFGLWFWDGWHYRFRWLLAAYAGLLASFAAILLLPNLLVLLLSQMLLGAALGLIYYSSLFYSMDVGETKGEHGGIHEAAIGLGNLAGPAVGAAALYLTPGWQNSGTFAVSALLFAGFIAMIMIWWFGAARAAAPAPLPLVPEGPRKP